ncbi:MAG: hypothetical protein EP317_05020 [Bacillota bacterium]|nr:MAG: hypothetical protein EP317_05020 [Bacillota bacterium]
MSKIILVTGHLAALKSTISTRLSKDFKMITLNKDLIKEVLGDTIGFNNREENLRLSKATFEMMKFMMTRIIDSSQNVILESNFKKNELDELKRILDEKKVHVFTLFLTGDSETLYQRYVSRQEYRHPVHKSTGLLSVDVFKAVMNEYKVDDCFGIVKMIDTSFFDEQTYLNIKQEVEKYLNEVSQHDVD